MMENIQGSTIRPLVNYLNVERKKTEDPTMAETVYNKVSENQTDPDTRITWKIM